MPDALILIVEHSRDLARLYQRTLEDEGLAVETVVGEPSPVGAVHRHRPQVIVLDVLPYGEQASEVLDALRADEVARETPVIVTTTSPEIAESAIASYNVRQALVKPFDLDAFVASVRQEAGHPLMHADLPQGATPPSGFMEFAEWTLVSRARHIVFRWIQRLRQEPPWSERDDLGLADLIDHAPVILEAVDVRLHYHDPAGFFERHPDVLDRARRHAQLRRDQGISLGSGLREYALLREEVWHALSTHPPSAVDPPEFFLLERAVNGVIDAIVAASAAEFVDEPEPPGTRDLAP